MSSFKRSLDQLADQLDPEKHEDEIAMLRRFRSVRDMDRLVDNGGWLSSEKVKERLKLVKHGSGTFLVVQYVDGWSTRMAAQPFPKGRR